MSSCTIFSGNCLTMEKKYYHFYSDGKKAAELFLSKSDFVAALNRLAVCAFRFPNVMVVAFTFEDTHVHFLLYCLEEEGRAFCDLFKRLTMIYISHTRGGKPVGLQLIFDVEEIEDESYLKKVGVYVLVQPTKDGKGIMPYDYPWGSAPLYFRGEKVVPVWCVDRHGVVQEAVRIGDMTCRERKKQFRTDIPLPDKWLTCNGIILPSNYVDIDRFEQIYRTHNAFRAFLSRSSDSEMIRQTAIVKGVSLPDHEMREACWKVCREIFGVRDVRVLDSTKRLELARRLRRRYLISSRQLSRIVHVPVDEIERLL